MSGNTADSPIASCDPNHKTLARQLSIRNSKKSRLVSLPPELLKLVSFYLTDPLDLLRFSYTCHELFFLTAPADWYSLATYTYTNWVKSCGGPKERDWKTMVLKDAALGVRLGYSLPPVPTASSSATSASLTVASAALPSALSPPVSQPIIATSVTAAADVTNFQYSASSVPLGSQWSQWATVSPSHRLPSSLDEFDRRRPLRVKLSEAQYFETDPETLAAAGAQWSVPSKSNGGDPRPHDHEILFYNLPDLTNPIARCGSDVWEKDKKTGSQAQPWYHPFTRDMMQVAQVVEIKHYPEDTVGGMRVVVVIAFGQRARPWVNNATDSHILGVWLMLKVIEVRVPVTPMTRLSNWMMNHFRASPSLEPKVARECARISPESVVKYESLEPRQHQITMHGRIVKLYSAFEPDQPVTATTGGGQSSTSMDVDIQRRKVDCIAIFGTQNSDVASAMVIKKVLFSDDEADLGKKTYSNKAVSRGVSCMTLFPDHSGYEHLLVLFNQHGRGMVWDWVHEKQITQLHMPIDDKNRTKGARRIGDEPANVGVVTGSTLATAGNPAGDAGVVGAPSPRRRVYYWGVQVSAALEVSFPEDLNNVDSNNGTFRIVTMADGADDEWESCWWSITIDVLQGPMVALPAPPIIDRNKSGSSSNATNATKAPLISSVKRFERKTYGVCLPEQQKTHPDENGRPIQFIAYVVWNHYRIGLSSRMGICMMDLEEPESGLVADRQWITFLKDREDLIDIAIFGHNLVVTLKTGHLVWSFYGQDKTPFVSREGLGLRIDTGRSLVLVEKLKR
ncbi:hypothetical protein BG015_003181 [Linnemannia schmuckeri]|uniref:F-box domain-containing protein n=1 Tax=Linnemannia schmuckeri TaxID=64567 RepID=A0A9P5VDF8_9FUNG|nr:hypothetical protein BG015_003181 [Linnemannia schmuckeri]